MPLDSRAFDVATARSLRAGLFLLVGLALAGDADPARTQPAPVDVIALIDTYAQGRYDEAIAQAAALPDLGPLRLRFVQDTPAWIAADPAKAERRRAAVAAFIVELAAARIESDWGRLSDLIEWTCVQVLRGSGPPTAFERSWHMATTALAGRARVRVWLLGPFARLPHQEARTPQKDDPPSPMHLVHALERFPGDPQFELARVIAWTWGRDSEPLRNARMRDDADWLPSRPPQLEAITAYEPLIQIAAVAPEALIRTGLVHVTVRNHAAALRAFEAAQPLASEPALKYLSHFLAGRSLEALGRTGDAIAQYRRALEIVPAAESAVIALSGLQFAGSDRESAIAAIDNLFSKPATSTDPGRLIGYGFFLRWPSLLSEMRGEL